MGKCIKCNNETVNSYKYYKGDVVDMNVANIDAYNKNVTVKYENIVEHNEHLCRKCAYDSLPLWIGGAVFCLFLLMLMVFLLFIPHPDSIAQVWFFAILLVFGMVVCLVRSRLTDYIKDTRIDETTAAVKIILEVKKRAGDNTPYTVFGEYLTPGLFKSLMPGTYTLKNK